MSTLLKALKKAEQDRREKLAAAAPASSTPSPREQLSLPVDDVAPAAQVAPAPVRPRINPLLVPAPVAKAPARYSSAAVVVAVSVVVVLAANMLYRPAPPVATNVPLLAAAPAASGSQSARLTLDTVTIPRALLGAGPDPLQLQLDRRADLKLVRNSGVAR